LDRLATLTAVPVERLALSGSALRRELRVVAHVVADLVIAVIRAVPDVREELVLVHVLGDRAARLVVLVIALELADVVAVDLTDLRLGTELSCRSNNVVL